MKKNLKFCLALLLCVCLASYCICHADAIDTWFAAYNNVAGMLLTDKLNADGFVKTDELTYGYPLRNESALYVSFSQEGKVEIVLGQINDKGLNYANVMTAALIASDPSVNVADAYRKILAYAAGKEDTFRDGKWVYMRGTDESGFYFIICDKDVEAMLAKSSEESTDADIPDADAFWDGLWEDGAQEAPKPVPTPAPQKESNPLWHKI